jgi:4-amino-4-deoxy-L-arabinose transferase-like glycosyltransferase
MISLVMFILVVALWYSNKTNRFWESVRFRVLEFGSEEFRERSGRTAGNHGFYTVVYLRIFLATFIPQIVVVGFLIGFGARTAARAQVQFGCTVLQPNSVTGS